MIIRIIPNIFEKEGRRTVEVEFSGKTIGELAKEHIADGEMDGYNAIVNGGLVEDDHVPSQHDEVIFSGYIGVQAIPALIVAGGLMGAGAAGWITMNLAITLAVSTLVGAALSMLVSSIFAPTTGNINDSFSDSKTYSWDGAKNIIGEGNVYPVVYGRHVVGGVPLESFVDGDIRNGVQENKYLNILIGTSEGPVRGIIEGSVKINNNRATDFDDNLELWERLGTQTQTPIANFSKVHRQYNMTSTVALRQDAGPYVYRTFNKVDEIKLTFECPALYYTESDGDVKKKAVELQIDWALDSATPTYHPLDVVTIAAKSKSAVISEYTYNLSENGGLNKYLIKITRLTPDADADLTKQDATNLKAVVEVETATCAYINTALSGIRLRANSLISGRAPDVTCILMGRDLADVRTGQKSDDICRNPANIIYDIMTNRRYGMGRYGVTEDNIDMPSLQAFADWADEVVDFEDYDPSTGQYVTKTQVRYKIDLVIDKPFKASTLIEKICNTCRVIPFWQGDKIKFVIEKPVEESEFAQTFNMSNIVADSFEETYTPWGDIPNKLIAQFTNAKNDYKQEPVAAIDKARQDEPIIENQLNLYGITNKARVKRELVFALKKPKGTRRSIKFKAPFLAVTCEPGDPIWFQHDIPQYGFGGHLLGATAGMSVSLNREIPLLSGEPYRIRITKKTGEFFTYQWTQASNVTTSVIPVPTLPIDIEAGDLWVAGPVDRESKPFRVMAITGDGFEHSIQATEINNTIHDEDPNVQVVDTNYSLLGLVARYDVDGNAGIDDRDPTNEDPEWPSGPGANEVPPFVEEVGVWEELVPAGDVYRSDIAVSFKPVSMPANSISTIDHYEIIFSNDGVTWEFGARASAGGYGKLIGVTVGETYYINVKPFTDYGRTNFPEYGANALDNSLIVQGKVSPPSAPDGLQVVGDVFMNVLTWNTPQDRDIKEIEIWRATGANNRAAAIQVGSAPRGAGRFTDGGLHQNSTYYYWIRAEDTAGNFSAWHPFEADQGVQGRPMNDPEKVLDLLSGSITEGQLNAELSTKVNLAETYNQRITDAEASVANLSPALVPLYNAGTTYNEFDFVRYSYGGTLYVYKATTNGLIGVTPETAGGVGAGWEKVANGLVGVATNHESRIDLNEHNITLKISKDRVAEFAGPAMAAYWASTTTYQEGDFVSYVYAYDATRVFKCGPTGGCLNVKPYVAGVGVQSPWVLMPYQAQDLNTRISTAETNITLNTSAINLRATKAEVETLTAPTWSSTKSYVVGDYVQYNYNGIKLYRCIVANTNTIPQTSSGVSSKWEYVTSGLSKRLALAESEIEVNATAITQRVIQAEFDTLEGVVDEHTAEMALMANQWTLKLASGNQIAGVGLLLYQDWSSVTAYVVGNYVWYNSNVYKCILNHTSKVPTNTTYWTLIPYGAQSEFIIRADKFAVVKSDGTGGTVAPFIVGSIGGVDTVGVNGALVVDGTITGEKIDVTTELSLREGGRAVFGDDNVIIETTDGATSDASIIVSKNGGPINGNDYAVLSDGDLDFFKWDDYALIHKVYKSVKRIEVGTLANGATMNIPGIFQNPPRISLWPIDIKTYNAGYSNQDQRLQLQATLGPHASNPNRYTITAEAFLTVDGGNLTIYPSGVGAELWTTTNPDLLDTASIAIATSQDNINLIDTIKVRIEMEGFKVTRQHVYNDGTYTHTIEKYYKGKLKPYMRVRKDDTNVWTGFDYTIGEMWVGTPVQVTLQAGNGQAYGGYDYFDLQLDKISWNDSIWKMEYSYDEQAAATEYYLRITVKYYTLVLTSGAVSLGDGTLGWMAISD